MRNYKMKIINWVEERMRDEKSILMRLMRDNRCGGGTIMQITR